jgi:hypothetical protein
MTSSVEDQVLLLLAKEWDFAGPPGILDMGEVAAFLSAPPSEVLGAVKSLFGRGLVDMNRLKTSIFLTPEGYAAAEGRRGGKPP